MANATTIAKAGRLCRNPNVIMSAALKLELKLFRYAAYQRHETDRQKPFRIDPIFMANYGYQFLNIVSGR